MTSTVETQLARAVQQHQSGDFTGAETLYREILAADPGQADALNLLGVACSQLGRHGEGETYIRQALDVRPDDPKLLYNLGNVLREEGALKDAAEVYARAAPLSPQPAPAFFNLGATLRELEHEVEAMSAFRMAAEADPTHVRARCQLAMDAVRRGEMREAATHWQAAAEQEPGQPQHRIELGIALHAAGACDDAADCFRHVTTMTPDSAMAWSNLGGALRSGGHASEAVVALRRAVELDPKLLAGFLNLAAACLDVNDVNAALTAVNTALALAPTDIRGHRAAARVLTAAGEHDAALEHLERAADAAPADATIVTAQADSLYVLGRLEDADEALTRAERLDPNSIDVAVGRVMLLNRRRDHARARETAEAARRRFPDDVRTAFALASAYVEESRYDDAGSVLEETLARPRLAAGEERMLLFKLAEARDRQADFEAAWTAVERANGLKASTFDREAFTRRIDAILEAFTATTLANLPRAEPGRVRPIVIAGVPRSGTSLVEQILDAHPDVTGGGEMCLLERTENRLEPLTGRAETYPACIAGLDPDAVRSLAAFGHDLLARVAGDTRIVSEKSLSNYLYLGLIELLYPEARVVLCTRNPLDTCLSCYFHDFVGALPWAYDLEDAGYFHREHDRMMEQWRHRLTLTVTIVRYEDLVAEPERMTRDLLTHCGLPWDDACLTFHETDRIVYTSSAEAVHQPIHDKAVGRHEHYAAHLTPLREALART